MMSGFYGVSALRAPGGVGHPANAPLERHVIATAAAPHTRLAPGSRQGGSKKNAVRVYVALSRYIASLNNNNAPRAALLAVPSSLVLLTADPLSSAFLEQ